MRTGLFFVLLLSICIALLISSSLPITGSSFPSAAFLVKSTPYLRRLSYSPSALLDVTRAVPDPPPGVDPSYDGVFSRMARTADLTSSRDTDREASAPTVKSASLAHRPRSRASVEMYESYIPPVFAYRADDAMYVRIDGEGGRGRGGGGSF